MKRTRDHLLGDLAEGAAVSELLLTGAAINSLRGSDYGWDLHLQLPRFGARRGARSWDLSSQVVHVQVKGRVAQPADGSLAQPVAVDNLRAWCSGPTPTFLLQAVVDGLDSASRPAMFVAAPYELQTHLRQVDEARPRAVRTTVPARHFRPFDATGFAAQAWLATLYPTGGAGIDPMPFLRCDDDRRLLLLLSAGLALVEGDLHREDMFRSVTVIRDGAARVSARATSVYGRGQLEAMVQGSTTFRFADEPPALLQDAAVVVRVAMRMCGLSAQDAARWCWQQCADRPDGDPTLPQLAELAPEQREFLS